MANGDLRKGVDLWPAFARGVLAKHPDTYFVWIGGIEPELRLWVRHDMDAIGHPDRLVTPGSVADLNPLYAMADVFLLSSREDPFPIGHAFDAMAHGLPLVAFEDSGGVTDVVRAGGGLTVPYLDIPEMINSICRLIDNATNERAAIGDAGRKIIARDFDFADYGFEARARYDRGEFVHSNMAGSQEAASWMAASTVKLSFPNDSQEKCPATPFAYVSSTPAVAIPLCSLRNHTDERTVGTTTSAKALSHAAEWLRSNRPRCLSDSGCRKDHF